MVRSRLAIIIPAKNEQKTISKVIDDLKSFGDIYVVNDCSSDETSKILEKFDINEIKNLKTIGYEKSIWKGITLAIKKKEYDFIATFDADGEHDPNFFKNLSYLDFDILIAKRNKFNRISEYIFSFFSKRIFKINDMLSGLRVYRVNYLKSILDLIRFDYINTQILILSHISEARIKEKKMNVSLRKGKSRFGNGILINLYIIFIMLKGILYFYNEKKNISTLSS